MIYKKILGGFLVLLLIFYFQLARFNYIYANSCSGSGSRTVTDEECHKNDLTNLWYCTSRTFTDSNTCVIDSSDYCGWNVFPECDCVLNSDKTDCDEYCRPASNTFFYTGCTTCATVNGNCNSEDYPNGVCTYANITKKCNAGTLSTIDSVGTDGYFNWKCLGNSCSDSTDATCQVRRIAPVAGAAGQCNSTAISTSYCNYSSIPTKCAVGTATLINDNLTNGIDWTCSGTTTGEVCGGGVGATVNCGTSKIAPVSRVDGACSDINNTVVQTKPTSGLCNSGTPSVVATSGTTYSWTCAGTNGVCPASTALSPSCSATQDTQPIPTITPIPIPPAITDPTPNPSGGIRLNNCQFSNPNVISTLKFSVTDANGISDVAGVYFRFKGTTTEYGPVLPTAAGLVTFSSIDITDLPYGTYTIEAKAVDVHAATIGSAWVDLDFQFKKWDCWVIVDGTIYDNSAGVACVDGSENNNGFGTTIPADIQPFTLAYGDRTASVTRNMTVVSPRFYSPDKLTWQNTHFLDYINTNNESFLGEFESMKIDGDCFPYDDYLIPKDHVNAYDLNPTINIQYSAVMDQEAWFRVNGGGILTSGKQPNSVTNLIPVTCVEDDCKTSTQGLVWSKDITLSSWDNTIKSEVNISRPISYGYETLKYDIYGGKEVGTTIIATTTNWSEIKNDDSKNKGELFISGNLVIDENVVPGISNYVLFVVGGNISIGESVTRVDGMLFAQGTITASGSNSTKLSINGSLYGRSGVILNRTYAIKRTNNTAPAVEITYDPNLIFKLNPRLWYTYENWKLE